MLVNPGAGRPTIRPKLVAAMVKAFLLQFAQHDMTAQEAASIATSVLVETIDATADTSMPAARGIAVELRRRLEPIANAVSPEELRRHTRGRAETGSLVVLPPGSVH